MANPKLTAASEVQFLRGVGPQRAQLLATRGIRTVEDLLYYTPFRYEDRARMARIRDLVPGQTATIFAKVLTCGLMRTRRGLEIYDLAASDSTGMLRCKWFNGGYLERNKVFHTGQQAFFYGKVDRDRYGTGNLEIVQPQFEILPDEESEGGNSLEINRVVPVYESMTLLGPRVLRRIIWGALEGLDGQIPDRLPPSVVKKNQLMDRATAVAQTHFPPLGEDLEKLCNFRTPAQQRLIFEEFFSVGAGLALKRRKAKAVAGIEFQVKASARQAIRKILPFHPTNAQKRVLREIVDDMCSARPMNRLLQGDVGSGKTIVAIQAAILAIENGYQVTLMAPTEILAVQHYLYIKQLFRPLDYRVELLISARKGAEKTAIKRDIAAGDVHLAIGTHALIEGDVRFSAWDWWWWMSSTASACCSALS